MSANGVGQFQRVAERGWQRRLGNLSRGEFSAWFTVSRWWRHLLLWVLIVDAMMGLMIFATFKAAEDGNDGPPLLLMYGIFGGMFVAFGVMVIMQRVLIQERQMGTATWVLSKPVTRTAFVISRLGANSVAILLTSVLAPGVGLYALLGMFSASGWLAPVPFAAGLTLVALHTLFWITLVLMMGTLSMSSSTVIAVPIALFFALWMVPGLSPSLVYISPLQLVSSPAPDQIGAVSVSLMTGTPVFSWLPLVTAAVSCVLFVAVAIWRFNRQEF